MLIANVATRLLDVYGASKPIAMPKIRTTRRCEPRARNHAQPCLFNKAMPAIMAMTKDSA